MTNYVTNSSGSAAVDTTFTPNGVPGLGDTITVATGHALTNVSGTLGDNVGVPLTIQGTGSATLSGNLELRYPGASAGIAFQGGTLNQGGNTITGAPSANGSQLATFANNGGAATVWNATAGATLLFSSAQGATSCGLFSKDNATTFALSINWASMIVDGWGNGTSVAAMNNHFILPGDAMTWESGVVRNCGRFSWRDGGGVSGTVNVHHLVIGWWNGTGYDPDNTTTQAWRMERAQPNANYRFSDCLWYKDAADTRLIAPGWASANYGLNMSNSIFINIPGYARRGSNASGCLAVDTGSASAGFSVDDSVLGLFPNVDDVAVMAQSEINPHLPSITFQSSRSNNTSYLIGTVYAGADNGYYYELTTAGQTGASPPTWSTTVGGTTADGAAVWTTRTMDSLSHVITGMIADGLGSSAAGEVGDMPLLYGTATLNNFLAIHGASGVNSGLATSGRINGNRWTIHNANCLLIGETNQARAWNLGTIRNLLVSQPKNGMILRDVGGFTVAQTSMLLDYVAFNPAAMLAANEDHPVLAATEGYVQGSIGSLIDGYGANDIVVTDPQYADSTRHGLTWTATFGQPATVTGLRDLLLAGYGVDASGATVAAVAGATPAAYRTYIRAGYVPANAALDGTGFGGVDIGAIDVVPPAPAGLLSSYTQYNRGFNA